ncbi:MAG: hypothetical protein ACE5R4_00655 [Armatimonadota bacterium]
MNRARLLSGLRLAFVFVGAVNCCCGVPQQASQHVWWEGESPAQTNFPPQSWFSASTFPDTRHLLSGGDWLSNSGDRTGPEAFATYRVNVPADGEYNLWTRKFWKHGPFRWRFGQDQWRTCGRDIALADDTYLKEHLGANWVFLGKVALSRGPQTFELRLLAGPGEALTAAFDCFVLVPGPFMPNGKWKPGERSNLADEGFFAFEPALDPFGPEALLDLRSLNEKVAGESGFVRRDGLNFALGNGQPVRFWAVNVGPNNIGQDRASIDYLARALAKRGVNMVRYHGPIFDGSTDPANVDPKRLDDIFYLVAALKREGIYTTLSFYFPLWFDIRPHYGIPGYDAIENKRPFALLYFDPRMQEIHRSWARALLTTQSPYTGTTLAREPAVAIVEIINEDSFFFWTFAKKNVPPVHWQRLETLYGQWLAKRYGSLDQALAAWGNTRLPEDDPATSRAGLYEAWHMTTDGIKAGGPDKVKRVGDQVRFLTELQRDYYASFVEYLEQDLGSGSLVSASNWHVTDGPLLDALERYTYSAGDVIDRHGYFGGKHEGDGASYSVRVGHTFESLAAVTVPERLPLQFMQLDGYPHTISEIGWPNPNRYRADATFLASAYGALQGVDGIYFFAVGSNFLRDASMAKFALSCPTMAGTFPAAALLYRRGDVAESESAVHQILRLEDLYAMQGSGASTSQALDELRRRDIPEGGEAAGAVNMLDPLTFYVGRVTRTLGEDPEQSKQRDLTAYIDREHKTVESLTGEHHWDYGNGLVRLDTPRSQGAAGFLAKAGRIDLSQVTIESSNEFGAILVVSLDGQPLATAKRILIQAMTEEQPYGFKVQGGRITDMGGMPLGVRKIAARVSLALQGDGQPTVTALDENGYATGKRVVASGGANQPLVIQLAEDAIYHVVQRS